MIKQLRTKISWALVGILMLVAPVGLASASQVLIGGIAYGTFPLTLSKGGSYPIGQWVLDFNGQFQSVSQVCVGFGFNDNLLDIGEQFKVEVPGTAVSQTLTNTGSTSLDSALVCFIDSASLSRFKDGRDVIRITAVNGSVTVSSMSGQLYL